MNERKFAEENKILEYRVGSYLYGTNTLTSDEDFSGVFIAPEEYYLGLNSVEEVDLSIVSKTLDGKNNPDAVDRKLYEFRKFVRLSLENNPNVIEQLFVDEKNLLFSNDLGRELLANRHVFLHRGLRHKFLGYSFSQKHKMIIRTDKFYELKNAHDWMVDFNKPETYIVELKDKNLPFMLFKAKHATIGDLDFELTRQLRWVSKKIEERLNKVGNRKELYLSKGYDCYHEDTEFLTENGWKKYDQIVKNESIATVNPLTKEIEFQIPFDRVKKSYSGKIYEFIGNYTRMCVTPNHRMFVSNCHRNSTNNFSTKYDEKNSKWQFVKLCDLLNKNRSCFHILNSVVNNKIDFKIEDDFLNVLGFFISEGCFAKFKNGTPKTIRIYQTNKGKNEFYQIMDSLSAKYNFRKHSYTRKNRPNLIETTWISYNHELVQKIFSECGNKKTKRLPNWIFQLSIRQIDILLNSLLLGDGTNKNNHVDVYYTSLKLLSDDVQTLGILGGREVNLNGPYTSISNYTGLPLTTYQVTITKKLGKPRPIILNPKIKKQKRFSKNFDNRGGNEVNYNGNIVCFSVPNELLLTRYKGKIAVQGNTKFASHFLRLLMEVIELLETGDLKFPLKDKEMLLEVKEGKWKLNDVLKLGEEIEKWVEKLSEKSPLPAHPQFDKINALVVDMLKRHFKYKL